MPEVTYAFTQHPDKNIGREQKRHLISQRPRYVMDNGEVTTVGLKYTLCGHVVRWVWDYAIPLSPDCRSCQRIMNNLLAKRKPEECDMCGQMVEDYYPDSTTVDFRKHNHEARHEHEALSHLKWPNSPRWYSDPKCWICGERIKLDVVHQEFAEPVAEMYEPPSGTSYLVHPECGIQAGWETS
jgi:hypothetical protein